MSHLASIGTDLEIAARFLREGEVVAMPTETVYGLAANAFDERAVAKIFEAKHRPTFDPLILHIDNHSRLSEITATIPKEYEPLMERFWPGPLTLIFEKTSRVSELVTSGLPTVAVRMPAHPVARQLIALAEVPLAAPSANLFGRTSPTTAAHVADQLADRIDYILDAGPCDVGVESTILRFTDGRFEILRPGGVTQEELSKCVSQPIVQYDSTKNTDTKIDAPGQLKEHYSPQTPLVVSEGNAVLKPDRKTGLLRFSEDSYPDVKSFERVITLSETGNLLEATSRFFAAIHELDKLGQDLIVATPFPNHGLGIALNDRLQRAAHRFV
ncbi:MAG: threonylcarbamoyl-AMP synthase [Rubinisphaera sp.]|uniref:L-threonylcarbamoyladenylate synthase n=1 Tax=Rubinisphaera sp. TaxID=2024857 RepID=UPI000C1169C9|nr:L-threonylcarbamoyladenylate synthase [Rubinisphaera sp.]MBV07836.1 threonylcarbamoyl-AMP synthase [Rubinisphaera sp.]